MIRVCIDDLAFYDGEAIVRPVNEDLGATTPLLHHLAVGDEVTIRPRAKGRFILDRTSGRTNHLLLCTVTGIAPFVSYVRTLKQEFDDGAFTGNHHLYLIQGASRSIEFAYREGGAQLVDNIIILEDYPNQGEQCSD